MRIFPKLTLNQWTIAIYIIINIGLYYAKFQSIITLSYLVLLLGFLNNLVRQHKCFNKNFIFATVFFLFYCFISVIWAESSLYAKNNVTVLLKTVLPTIILVSLIHSKTDFKIALKSFAFASFLYSLLFIPLVDISELQDARITEAIESDEFVPNVNVISMCSSFACMLFAFYGMSEKKIYQFIIAIVSFIITVILGSRKSLLAIFVFLAILFYKSKSKNKSKLIGYLTFAIIAMIIVVPKEYLEFIVERFNVFQFFISGDTSVIDESDNNRIDMLKHGMMYFLDRPILGNGFMNFAVRFFDDGYMLTYSHNNFIELLSGLGVFGFIIYYIPYYLIFKNIKRGKSNKWLVLIGALLIAVLFNSFFIVFITTRFMWFLVAILYAGSRYCKYDISVFE